MTVAIMTDNQSGIFPEEGKKLGVYILRMPFFLDGKQYYENETITAQEFFDRMEHNPDMEFSTSMPPAGEVLSMWKEALKTHDEVVYIPMSSGLSSSCETATLLAQQFDGKVQVVNNQRISLTQRQSVYDAMTLRDQGKSAKEIKDILEAEKFNSSIYIMVGSLDYLKRGGRVTPAAALLGGLLRIRPILQIQGEKLDAFAKARSLKAAKKIMFDALHKDLDGRFKPFVDKKEMEVYISYTHGQPEQVKQWFEEVKTEFSDFNVTQDPLSLSISCHTGPGCLGIGCARKVV
ncbi:MAG: DegV family protein [Absicoccus porci]|jgi:DegV family protein with EDD domain|uniref:DegV family protein n=1 Tax=Absicoccus porci TaxID=2486576 RepID=A0A3N0HWU4_9FIRM|nr:DegV family protein [Absicoccus porci]MDD6459436.1 DegV family protein [Absicoccus porci]MDD7329740.1 DegV family protein [Absicoccus porci]MDY4738299.1 DegV family protein [Absicoccus porci]MEE1355592.1 DegV family protein [Absicoccus porci]RNM29137.1 DegV family protein [Absicoccus porci]